MTTRDDVAQWMFDMINQQQSLSQEEAVWYIEQQFGQDWVYETDSGGTAIHKNVLASFKRLHKGRVEWENGEKAWYLA